ATFTYGGGSIYVDCGEGTLVGGSALSSGTVSCSYTEIGDYTVKLSGDFTYFGGVSGKGAIKNIIKLDKSGITKMSKVCGSTTIGVLPPLPSTLVDATKMFEGCTKINSPYPKLPATLEMADNMFYECSALTGTLPAFPSGLKTADSMFRSCIGLTGSVPTLPSTLTDADYMFYDPSGKMQLSGKAPKKPASLTNYLFLFRGTKVTNDGSWPTAAFQ
ncbi:MAG: hypothetical protein IJV97_05335, partial [Alphaproteobacteria bacterium]|nr:hypothetical protein [Alphaproteobacteria bacterium]